MRLFKIGVAIKKGVLTLVVWFGCLRFVCNKAVLKEMRLFE